MDQEVYQHTFANGLTLLAERMEHVRSAAFNFLIPAGCAFDAPEHSGLASALADWITRGAGSRDSRELTLALDNLGVDHSENAGIVHMHFWGATLSDNVLAGLELYADILRRPLFDARELDAIKALALQEIYSIEDNPPVKLARELRARHFPDPLGRDPRGTEAGIKSLTPDIIREAFRSRFQPNGAILTLAGNFDWHAIKDKVESLFGDWEAGQPPSFELTPAPGGTNHLTKETAQTHIMLAYPSVPYGHEDYYTAYGAAQVLSGGMGSRLFTEVREKESLCYAVSASYLPLKTIGAFQCYAGTSNDRAQKTLDVTLRELRRLGDGVEEDEVDRVKAGLKSSLIMQQESTSSRAASLAVDWYYLSRVRSLDEIQAEIERLTTDRIADYARRYPPENLTVVTIGPKPLQVP